MSRGLCSPEQQGACPLIKCRGTDRHHLAFPDSAYRSPIEKEWRVQPYNKIQIPRCVHNAIHASGYRPDKPSRQEMASEIWEQGSQRAAEELNRQLAIGSKALEGFVPLPEEYDGA